MGSFTQASRIGSGAEGLTGVVTVGRVISGEKILPLLVIRLEPAILSTSGLLTSTSSLVIGSCLMP